MLLIELQFFGGRGSGGGKGTGGGGSGKSSPKEIGPEESSAWSEDPSLYQRLADPDRRKRAITEMREDGYTEEEIQDFVGTANRLRDLSESQTIDQSTLYRGERFNSLQAAQAKYKVGAEISTTQLTSYATDKNTASSYARMYGKETTAVVITNTSTKGGFVGVRMQHYGEAKGKGAEVIAPKGITSRVVSTRYNKSTNTLFVTMENSAVPTKRRSKKGV